jgi:hypothetical protein
MTALNGVQMMREVNAVYLERLKIAPCRQSFRAAQRQPEGELRDMSSGREQTTLRSE